MRRLSEVIKPARSNGYNVLPYMKLNFETRVIRFTNCVFSVARDYKYVDFLEDEEENMIYVLFNNERGFRLVEKTKSENSGYYKFSSAGLTKYLYEKYNIQDKLSQFICAIGAKEVTTEGLKIPLFYEKPI